MPQRPHTGAGSRRWRRVLSSVAPWYPRHRVEVLLATVVLLVCAPVVALVWAQSAPRYAFTAAVVDQHTVRIDDYTATLGVDRAEKDGHTYLDKAPGQPVLAVPLYAAYRLVGGEPASQARTTGNLGVWWQTLWCCAVPAALLAIAMRREASEVAPEVATIAALSLALGSLLLPFGTMLFGHVLSALLGFTSYRLLVRRRPSNRALACSGVLAGAAVFVEYTTAIVFVVLAVAVVALHHRRALGWFAGAAAPGAALAAYQWAAFGSPTAFSYKYSAFAIHHSSTAGIGVPNPVRLLEVLLGERGFFTLTPLMLIGIVGLVLLLREPDIDRARVIIPLAVVALFLLFHAGWTDATGGDSPGPRHLIPSIPFLAAGVAVAWQRYRQLVTAVAGFSVGWMMLATFTNPIASEHVSAVQSWLHDVRTGQWADSILTMRLGHWALLVALVAAAFVARRLLSGPAGTPVGSGWGPSDRAHGTPTASAATPVRP
ncbi:MAG: hypothetical protein QOG39_160 [Acidimicrobiaceae bacterium]